MTLKTIILSITLLSLFACQSETKKENENAEETSTAAEAESPAKEISSNGNSYYPLKAGSSWTYGYTSEFEAVDSGTSFTVRIKDEGYEHNGKKYLSSLQEYKSPDGKVSNITTMYARIDSEGNVYSFMPKVTEEEVMTMPADIKVGETWSAVNGVTTKLIATDGSIETPVKTYTDCLVITSIIDEEEGTTTYLAKGIGMVAIEMDGKLMSYLKEYKD